MGLVLTPEGIHARSLPKNNYIKMAFECDMKGDICSGMGRSQ